MPSDTVKQVTSHLTTHCAVDQSNVHQIYLQANELFHALHTFTDLNCLKTYDVNVFPGRTIRHANGRIRLKYSHFRPRNGYRIRCTVLRCDYSIIRCRIRCPFLMLCKRAIFDCRIRPVLIPYEKSALYGSRLCAVTTHYIKKKHFLIMRYSKMMYNRYFSLN